MASDRFSNKKYVSWLTSSLSLQYAKEGLVNCTNKEVDKFHNQLQPPSSSHCSTNPVCLVCDKNDLKKQWARQNFRCPNNVCNHWLAKLQNNHVDPGARIQWDNIDVSLLPQLPWECAKLYLPFGSQGVNGAEDADIAALLTLYLNCQHFDRLLGNIRLCEEIKTLRNTIMHSKDMEMEITDMENGIEKILKLLQDQKHFAYDDHCKEAVRKIEKLRDDVLELSLNKELELRCLNDRIQQLERETNQLQHTYRTLNSELQTLTTTVQNQTKQLADVHVEDLVQLKIDYNTITKESEKTKTKIVELQSLADLFTTFLKASGIENVGMRQLASSASKLSSLNVDVDRLKQVVTEIERTATRVELKLTEHDQEIEQIKEIQRDQKRKLDEMERKTGSETDVEVLRISGVPEIVEYESTDDYITRVCKDLNVSLTLRDIDISHRVVRKEVSGNKKPFAIIVKFATYRARQMFYKSRFNLKSCGYANIFVNEDLTKKRNSILYRARLRVKSSAINRAWSSDGQILIKDRNAKIFRSTVS